MQTLSQRLAQARERVKDDELALLLDEVQQVLEQLETDDPVGRALAKLSYSEEFMLKELLESMPDAEVVEVVTAHVANRVGLSRSTVVSVLRRLESAGLIQTRSMGMKGTRIVFLGGLTASDIRRRLRAGQGVTPFHFHPEAR